MISSQWARVKQSVTASADGFSSVSQSSVSVLDNATATADFSLNPVTTATTVSVASITYTTEGGKDKDKHLLITVALLDNLSPAQPVSGASVSIDLFHDETVISGTATTGTNGEVTFTLKNARSGCYKTTVTDVTAIGLTWVVDTPDNELCK